MNKMKERRTVSVKIALMLGLLIGMGGDILADEEAKQLQAVMQKVAPSIVTVEVVVKSEWTFGGQTHSSEHKHYLGGVVVSSDGLVMVNNLSFSASRWKEALEGSEEAEGQKFDIKPVSFKVTFEKEEKEYDAFIAATESKFDLAFLKVEGLGDRKLTQVDFSKSVDVSMGEKVVGIGRLRKGFDYAPHFTTSRVCGEITKPRRAWIIQDNVAEAGLPVFTLSGELVGVWTSLSSGIKEARSRAGPFMGWMMGRWAGMEDSGTFLIPGSAIKGLIEQASKRAAELSAERAKSKSKEGR